MKQLQQQKYDWRADQSKVVDDFQVNDDPLSSANQWAPAVAADNLGNSMVVWEDWRNGNRDIFAQLLDIDGKKIRDNFVINDDGIEANQKDASILATRDNKYLIVWRDDRNGNDDIFGQVMDSNGQRIGKNFRVNEPNSAVQMSPSLAESHDGSLLVVWEDWRNGNVDVYGRRLSATFSPTGTSFKINDDFSPGDQTSPKVAFDGNGTGVVVWRDGRAAKDLYTGADIYAQKVSNSGKLLGGNFMVNEKDNGDVDQANPDLAISSRGEVLIVWRDNRNENLDIYGQLYDANGNRVNGNKLINDDNSDRAQRHPSVCINSRGEFMVVWADRRNENFDIYAQCFAVNGQEIGQNFRVNDDFGSPAVQNEPVISCDASGNMVLSWIDYRYMTAEHKSDVFAQRNFFDNLLAMAQNKKAEKPVRNLTTHQSN